MIERKSRLDNADLARISGGSGIDTEAVEIGRDEDGMYYVLEWCAVSWGYETLEDAIRWCLEQGYQRDKIKII